ncbi:ankyrin repeat protein, putative [Trichomonas vaginalis G3]|uniref:Ankyrin repeat protein, putative n=1 Tax=Trichomonas vaginalis (strain ATCC PRA-98 / G3) TaxID=412133 RepID=A2FEP1_TRIV3|nr:ankyrin repeat protein, putative [Trichomonas vaginalis G3]|eukprot:XP_001309551.1 ankyrin repeat protein [Trichomonas vaginalis G3]
MSQGIIQNYEYIASHISDYIKQGNFFDIFETEDIKKIMKISYLTVNDFNALIKQSYHTTKANKLYTCTRNSNIHIENLEDVISTLKSIKKYMKLEIINGIIDFLDHKAKEMFDSTEKIPPLQADSNSNQNQTPKSNKETKDNQINDENNNENEILSKIPELKESDDFESIYNFLDELSSQGNQTMISKSCEEELWKKIAPKKDKYDNEKNVLHVACEKGILRLVKSLIEHGCDKETKSKYGLTPLIFASANGHLQVVKYLISVGDDKETEDYFGYTPLIKASENGHLEVVKYLISIGDDKDANNLNGDTPLICASENGQLEVVKYLISIGADKDATNHIGSTPLIVASWHGHLEVVKYLISNGAKKEAKDKHEDTPLIYASWHGHLEVVK